MKNKAADEKLSEVNQSINDEAEVETKIKKIITILLKACSGKQEQAF